MKPSDCAILVPVGASLEPATEATLRSLVDRGYSVTFLRNASQVDLGRSMMATAALRNGFAETLWIDADQVFTVDDVMRIRAHGKPFTAGLYPKKGPKEFAAKFRDGTTSVTLGAGGGLLEMEYVALGFTHLRREVYEAVQRKWNLPECEGGYDGQRFVPYFLPMLVPLPGGGRDYLSDDYAFCYRARAAGFAPCADTRLKIGHQSGNYTYTWDDLIPRPVCESVQVAIQQTPRTARAGI